MNSDIKKVQLKGHTSSILCLAHTSSSLSSTIITSSSSSSSKSSSKRKRKIKTTSTPPPPPPPKDILPLLPCALLSGSEDGTARLWDLKTRKASLCMVPPVTKGGEEDLGGVSSVAFEPICGEDFVTREKEESRPYSV
mmetsp:Transcript_13793/g.20219  ORF Transcript_13793/g.20219 Transcript_13793/m.20219 type:complete len:138 (-) Transcript_13793:19-432(-)